MARKMLVANPSSGRYPFALSASDTSAGELGVTIGCRLRRSGAVRSCRAGDRAFLGHDRDTNGVGLARWGDDGTSDPGARARGDDGRGVTDAGRTALRRDGLELVGEFDAAVGDRYHLV